MKRVKTGIALAVLGCFACGVGYVKAPTFYRAEAVSESGSVSAEGKLWVEFIDVEQADSILIKTPEGEYMLIDAGADQGKDGTPVREALENEGVESLDVVVATHPHYDHIAEMDYVIENYDIGAFYLPDTEGNYESSAYTKMLDDLEEYNVNCIYPDVPGEFYLGEVKCEILSPTDNESGSCNEYSLVIKMTYGENSFLFTGDAGSQSEYVMIDRGFDLSADVLKVGHHGSAYSTTREFLDEVNPTYAVISCSSDNSYGHPSELTLSRLEGVDTYITKDVGDIIFISDGENIEVYTEREAGESGEAAEEAGETVAEEYVYVGNKGTKVFHSADCGSLPKEENRVYFSSKEEASAEGYREHSCVK